MRPNAQGRSAPTAPAATSGIRWGAKFAFLLLVSVTSGAALVSSARWWFVGELASHFRFHLGVFAFVCAAGFLLVRSRKRAGLLLVLAWWGAWPEGALFLSLPWSSASSVATGEPSLTVVCANVLRSNDRYDEVLAAVERDSPDVIGLLEMSPPWRERALETLGDDYPFSLEGTDNGRWDHHTWGLLLLSKVPLVDAKVEPLEFGPAPVRPIVEAGIDVGGRRLTVQLVHPQRPGAEWRYEQRAFQTERIRTSVVTGERLVIGDLNMTSTSPVFRDLVASTGLVDSRRGFGRQPTYRLDGWVPGPVPVWVPPGFGPSVAIDHALVSKGVRVLDRSTFAIPGSDHRGVRVTVAVPGAD